MCEEIVSVKGLRLRCALVDHISSASATLFPVKEIVEIIRKWSPETLVMIDGAHAIGQIELDLVGLDCDYYISNLHKWFLAPRGCSFLYLKDVDRLEKNLQPNYISHGYDRDLNYNFYRRGTADKSSFFCVRECVQFYEEELGKCLNSEDLFFFCHLRSRQRIDNELISRH
jgi:aspartate aminotransferase-like enzyme